jgi:hypothetical protein
MIRERWTREQAIKDIQCQLDGRGFDEEPQDTALRHGPAQGSFLELLRAPLPPTVEDQRARMENAIIAGIKFCLEVEGTTERRRTKQPLSAPVALVAPPATALQLAIDSVKVKDREQRPKRCFICIDVAQKNEHMVEQAIKEFATPGALSQHFKRHVDKFQPGKYTCGLCNEEPLDKDHLKNHAQRKHGTIYPQKRSKSSHMEQPCNWEEEGANASRLEKRCRG